MLFKKKKTRKYIPKETSYMQDLFGVMAKEYEKPDEIVKLETRFPEETVQLLTNGAIDFTNDDVRDSHSDSIAESTKRHYEMQKIEHDFTNRNLVVQSQKYTNMIDENITVLDKMISIYSNKVFKEELYNE